MKFFLNREQCKILAFWSTLITIILFVIVVNLMIWDITTSEFAQNLIGTVFSLFAGLLIIALVNFLFLGVQERQEDEFPTTSPEFSDALKKAKGKEKTDSDHSAEAS